MTIVGNTTPLCYLALIGQVEILPRMYGQVIVPETVILELRHPDAPPTVRDFLSNVPSWLNVQADPPETDPSLNFLDPGERKAILLAERCAADIILLDEAASRRAAALRGLKMAGTLGVLCEAAQLGLIHLPAALDRLRATNFRASPELWKLAYSRA